MYAFITNHFYIDKIFHLVPLREKDIYQIKEWRNAQMDVLRQQTQLTDNDQSTYFTNVVVPSFSAVDPKLILFSFLETDTCIGYGGLTNVDWHSKRAEVSFLSKPDRVEFPEIYTKDFTNFLTLIKRVAFEEIGFNRLYTETYDIRPLHLTILEKNGFQLEGVLKEHVSINNHYRDSLIHGYLKRNYDR